MPRRTPGANFKPV